MEANRPNAVEAGACPLVYIIVITWNGREHLESCLPSLQKTDYPNFRVLLVDNGSSDGSTVRAREILPGIEVLSLAENLGFAAGNNRGIEYVLERGAKYIVLLNDDTKLLSTDWLASAVSIAESGGSIGMIGFELTEDPNPAPAAAVPVIHLPVKYIPGCALLIRAEVIAHIGNFDEAYFNYFEEDDLEARAVRAGWRLVEINRCIYHRSEGTSSRVPVRSQYLAIRNSIRCSLKNRSALRTIARCARLFDICCNPFPLTFLRDDISHRRLRRDGNPLRNIPLYLAAVGWNVLMLPGTLGARRQAYSRTPWENDPNSQS